MKIEKKLYLDSNGIFAFCVYGENIFFFHLSDFMSGHETNLFSVVFRACACVIDRMCKNKYEKREKNIDWHS